MGRILGKKFKNVLNECSCVDVKNACHPMNVPFLESMRRENHTNFICQLYWEIKPNIQRLI